MAHLSYHVEECKRKLGQYRTQIFPGLVAELDQQTAQIHGSITTLQICAQLLSPPTLLSLEPIARQQTIEQQSAAAGIALQAKTIVELIFNQIYGPIQQPLLFPVANFPSFLVESVPSFEEWLNEIASLRVLFYKQNLVGAAAEIPAVTLRDFQGEVDSALDHLEKLYQALWRTGQALESAKKEALSAPILERSVNVSTLQQIDLLSFLKVEALRTLCHNIYQRFCLIITQQPDAILMKPPGRVQPDSQRSRKDGTSTRTSMSVMLLNFQGHMNLETLPEIRVGMISESRAESIVASRGSPSMFIEYDANTYQCSPEIVDDGAATPLVANKLPLEQFIRTTMESRSASFDEVKQKLIYLETEMKLTSISVTNLKRNSYDKTIFKTSQQKFYFLVTVTHPFWTDNVFETAWTISTPVIVRTNVSQLGMSLATISWWTYFSENNSIPCVMKERASLEDIKVPLADYFRKWTCFEDAKQGLQLSHSQLNFIARMIVNLERSKSPDFQPGSRDQPTMITLKHLYYANLPNSNFTLWSWFFKAAFLLKSQPYLRELWEKRYFSGFLGKDTAFKRLHRTGMQVGDYILRYSESQRGIISCTFVTISEDPSTEFTIVNHAFKLDTANFKSSFLDAIYRDARMGTVVRKAFSRLYPNKPTLQAFPRRDSDAGEGESHLVDNADTSDDEEEYDIAVGDLQRRVFPYVKEVVVLYV